MFAEGAGAAARQVDHHPVEGGGEGRPAGVRHHPRQRPAEPAQIAAEGGEPGGGHVGQHQPDAGLPGEQREGFAARRGGGVEDALAGPGRRQKGRRLAGLVLHVEVAAAIRPRCAGAGRSAR